MAPENPLPANGDCCRKGKWAASEDAALRKMIELEGDSCSWVRVAKGVPGRSAKQCRERWSCNLDPSLRSGGWTSAEDALILGRASNTWAQLTKSLPGRSENAIKTRAKSLARAQRRAFTAEEDRTITEMRLEKKSWADIAAVLPKRTKNAVRTRARQLKAGKAASVPYQRVADRPRLSSISNTPLRPAASTWRKVTSPAASTTPFSPLPSPPSSLPSCSPTFGLDQSARTASFFAAAAETLAAAASAQTRAALSQNLGFSSISMLEARPAKRMRHCNAEGQHMLNNATPLYTPGSTPATTPVTLGDISEISSVGYPAGYDPRIFASYEYSTAGPGAAGRTAF